jgi:LuxR family maltose regulon positive regulatory protein
LLERRLSYKEIGNALSISPLTVKRHAGNIYDKLGAGSRREAVAIALELGWKPDRERA